MSFLSEKIKWFKAVYKYRRLNKVVFWISLFSLISMIALALLFAHNNVYKGEGEWLLSDNVFGTYGDFIGGVFGTFVAFVSAYLLYKSLFNQTSVNNTTVYQSYLQVFDNNFHSLLNNYKNAIENYKIEYDGSIAVYNKKGEKCFIIDNPSFATGKEALEIIATNFSYSTYSDKRPYLSRVKSATEHFDNLYSEYKREMSLHFRLLYLFAKYIGDMSNTDKYGNLKLSEKDRVYYAKSLRGQLSDGELLLLRYNCMTERGAKMQPYVNQFNLLKHISMMSLLEFRKYRNLIRNERDANTLDAHFIKIKKGIKDMFYDEKVGENIPIIISPRYTIKLYLSQDYKSLFFTLTRKTKKPKTGSDGTPAIEKALNTFLMDELSEMYKDLLKDFFIASNFQCYNSQYDMNISSSPLNSLIQDSFTITVSKETPIIVYYSANQKFEESI